MDVETINSEILQRESDSEHERLILDSLIDGDTNNHKADGYLETWAGNFGTCQDRRQGRRELYFDESLDDMAEQVSACLEALSIMTETIATQAWRDSIADGFCLIATLVCEAGEKTLKALSRENSYLQKALKKARTKRAQIPFNDHIKSLLKRHRQYNKGKLLCLGLTLVDCLTARDREIFMGMIGEGASPEQLKELIGTIEISVAESTIHSNQKE